MTQHTAVDHIVFALLLVLPFVEWKWNWPRYLAKLAAGDTQARLNHYRKLVAGEWIPTIALLIYWAFAGRSLADLHLIGDIPLRLGLGVVYVAALIGVLVRQRRALLARPDRRARVRKALQHAEPLLPHTQPERRLFWLVSATAGCCEEIFYRGFLTWYLSIWTGPVAAVVLASLLFGIGHIYLGLSQVPKTALVGLILAVVVALTGSLWPAMILHAAVDWNSGEMAFKLLSDSAPSGHSPTPPF
ncbi:CPBP family intramembrane metalloprotease [Telmatobacter sp. DSM 110680]|uniref:CPBP family intramembrane metalloprotease n=1 Tax=Telmatobacter sp. DSM 110680 TaxID=3036704 RepID=A0AAU7DQ85_9BACT